MAFCYFWGVGTEHMGGGSQYQHRLNESAFLLYTR